MGRGAEKGNSRKSRQWRSGARGGARGDESEYITRGGWESANLETLPFIDGVKVIWNAPKRREGEEGLGGRRKVPVQEKKVPMRKRGKVEEEEKVRRQRRYLA